MKGETLRNPPLIEAIFEIRWRLEDVGSGLKRDPHYSLLVGRLYDKLSKDYPHHDQLPTASFPSEMMPGFVQHQFRTGKDKWPVVQLGPGVLTINDAQGYTWADFEKRVITGVDVLFDIYPNAEPLVIERLELRYVNGLAFDFEGEDICQFLGQKIKTNIALHSLLFDGTGVRPRPLGFDCRFAFRCTRPGAMIRLRFARGKKDDADALIWETVVDTQSDNMPSMPKDLGKWLQDAHDVIEDWFFKLIAGDLERRFSEC